MSPSLIVIWCLQNKRNSFCGRMTDHADKCLQSYFTFSDSGMAVLMAAKRIHAVI